MIQRFKLLFSLTCLLMAGSYGFTQSESVPDDVIYFPQVKNWMQAENDTLYIINFWATWCRPCVKELPYFEKLNEELAGKKAKVILISLDFVEDYQSRYAPFLQKKKLTSAVYLLDEPKYNTWIDKVSEEWSGAIPATLLSTPDRSKSAFYEQEFETYEDLTKIVNPLITE